MKSLTNEIIDFLKTLTYEVTVTVRSSENKATPKYPMITVSEINNATRMALHGAERFSDISYQINVFSKDMYPTSGNDVTLSIALIVDDYMLEQYGFKRGSFVSMPDINDLSVSRTTIRYYGVLDTINEYIYQ